MRKVIIHTVPVNRAMNMLTLWEKEDKYYSSIFQNGAKMNAKARRYPYIPANEAAIEVEVYTDLPLNSDPINVVYLDIRSDSGLPHTRGMTGIALPQTMIWHPDQKTLDHEIVHISQKQFPTRWWNWYKRVWNFRIATVNEYSGIPVNILARMRINPDLLASPFSIWNDRYIPLSLFLDEGSPDLRKCKRGFWDLKMTQWIWESPPGWYQMFGSGFNDEHPHEIAAHWIDGSAGNEKKQYFHLNSI